MIAGASDPYAIVPYEAAHKSQVLKLQRHLWGADPALNRAYFDWKYEQNPFLARPIACVALHGDDVVGMRGICGARWRAGRSGASIDLPYTDDLVIAPEHRDRGLARRLIRALVEQAHARGYPFLISLRSGRLTLFSSLAEGYRAIGELRAVVRTSSEPRRLRALRGAAGSWPLLWRLADSSFFYAPSEKRPFLALDRAAHRSSDGGGYSVEVASEPRPAEMAALCSRLPADERIHHERSEAYLSWVFRNPRLEYRYLYAWSERLEGYLVLDRVRTEWRVRTRVNVSDWEASRGEVGSRLLAEAVTRGRFSELVSWTATDAPEVREALSRLGFVPLRAEGESRGPIALLHADHGDDAATWTIAGRSALDMGHWRLRMLDQD